MRRVPLYLAGLMMLALSSGYAEATTIVPAADPGELARDSHAVFLARAGASRAVERPGYLATATDMEVVKVIKGPLAVGEVIESIVPGGFSDGIGWAVAGAPKLEEGEVYLFFADRDPRGRWQPRLMADSVLRRETTDDGGRVLVRLDEASHLNRAGGFGKAALVPGPVMEDQFVEGLTRSLTGETEWKWDPMLREDLASQFPAKAIPAGCAFMEDNDGTRSVRWNRWDFGGSPLTIRAEDSGDFSVPGGGFTEVSNAISRWNNEPDPTSINLSYGGKVNFLFGTCEDGDFNDYPPPGNNIVVFNDPCDDIADLNGCSGTLAFGGPYFGSIHSFDGTSWWTASSLFVVVNNGAGCMPGNEYELMITHELGHGLGFDHVSDGGALMNANCCNAHNSTDIACAQYAYPLGTTPVATNTPTRTPTRTPTQGSSIPTPTPTRTPTRTPTPGGGGTAASKVTVPVVVHSDGVGGTAWRSDVAIGNRNSTAQTLRFTYQSPTKASFQVTRSLAGFATLLLEDLVQNLFRAGDGRGPLEVEVLHGGKALPVVVSRAYAEASTGNLGSGLPADVEHSTSVVSMPGLFHDGDFRTNVAVTAGDEATWATFELFRGNDGLVAGGVQRKIEAGEQNQWSIKQLFGEVARDGVPMTVRVTLTQPGIVYASLVDNASTDSAVFLGKAPGYTWIVPVVAHLSGAGGTFWSSSVAIWNTTGFTASVELEYLPEKTDNSSGGMVAENILLGPHTTRNIDDVLFEKFGISNGKGVLMVRSTRTVSVVSRVFTACETCPGGGSSGNGVRAVRSTSLTSGDTVLPGVRLLDGFRTNVGLVTGGQSVPFTIDLRDQGGTLRATAFKTLPPKTLQQWSVENLFGRNFVKPDPAGSIVVSADQPYLAYITVIDGTSQDPVFVMPQ
ncbi:MAG: matrixin family metalloprotease [Acidobacteria bacterium]|nr:matrixin family metalloprotease [Acidobacteriota bacterium]